jgi:hypothetical protein
VISYQLSAFKKISGFLPRDFCQREAHKNFFLFIAAKFNPPQGQG